MIKAGIEIIKRFEGLGDGDTDAPSLQPYLCPANVVTIGWGHVVYYNKKQLKGEKGLSIANQIYPSGITEATAEAFLIEDINVKYTILMQMLKNRKIDDKKLNNNQIGALTSLIFNIGAGNFKKSEVLYELQRKSPSEVIANRFHLHVKSKGTILLGLVRRRKAEAELFVQH